MYFSYDGNGDIISATYLNENYYYIINPEGDVIAFANESITNLTKAEMLEK